MPKSQRYVEELLSEESNFGGDFPPGCQQQSRHNLKRELPVPVYIGLNIHTQTRSKNLVQQLAKLGIGFSYERICEIENTLAISLCNQFEVDTVVCPVNLRKGIFTVGALGNLDYNPSSTTAQGSFHGTGISIIQFPTEENQGLCRGATYGSDKSGQKPSLPESFTMQCTCYIHE